MERQPYQPQPLDYMRQAAALRSYTTPAVITLALYFLFWIPGLVTNIVYLVAANDDRRKSGMVPQGRGCLIALLVVFAVIPALALCATIGLPFMRALLTGSAS